MNLDSPCVARGGNMDDPLAQDWDRFVSDGPSKHVEQLLAWGEARRQDGWTAHQVVHQEEGRIAGAALILIRQFHKVLRVGYLCKGPLLGNAKGPDWLRAAKGIVLKLKDFAKRQRLFCLIVEPPYFSDELHVLLRTCGFSPHLKQLPPSGLAKGTLLIDLRPSEEELLMGMRRSTRSALRKAGATQVISRIGGKADVDLLWNLMIELCRRRGATPNISSPKVMHAVWDRFNASDRARIDVLEMSGQPLAALMTFCIGSWAIPWRIGWSGAEPRISPEKILYWAVIRDLRMNGATTFDFNWVDPDEADAVRAGRDVPESTAKGVTKFKMGFGGEIVRLQETLDYFPNPLARVALRWGGSSLLESRAFAKLARRISGLRKRHSPD